MADSSETTTKKPRHRSPAYPTVSLKEAVERASRFYKIDTKAGAPPALAVKHMGFATAHGQAMSVLAALKKFGLVAESNGRIVPTQRTIEIIELPTSDPRRLKAVQDAVLSPSIYQELIEQHRKTGWPADDVLEAELVTYKNFNPHAVEGFVRDLKESLDFAGLSDISALESIPTDDSMTRETAKEQTGPTTLGKAVFDEVDSGSTLGETLSKVGDRMRGAPLLNQTLVVSIPRNFKVEIGVRGDELKKEDLAKIKSQFDRWIEGLEEAFED